MWKYSTGINLKNINLDKISHFRLTLILNLMLTVIYLFLDIIDKLYEIIYYYFSIFVLKTKMYSNFSPVWADGANLNSGILLLSRNV